MCAASPATSTRPARYWAAWRLLSVKRETHRVPLMGRSRPLTRRMLALSSARVIGSSRSTVSSYGSTVITRK